MKDYAIIYNPTSAAGKSREGFELAKKTLTDLNVSFDLFETERFAHAIELSEQCAKDGYRVIGAGGDGTCNEILNGVIYSQTKQLLGFIPMGSGNDIPAAVGYKPDIKRACEIIAEGTTFIHDVGCGKTGELERERYFLGIGSQGFDAAVTKITNEGDKNLDGTLNYVKNVLKLVFSFKKKILRIILDDETVETQCNLVAVANGPSYGGGMYICPYAKTNDDIFHISIVNMGTLPLLKNFNSMYSRCLHPHPKVYEYISSKVRIEMVDNEDEPYLSQVDGEIIGNIPVEYDFLKGGYEFIAPKENEMELLFDEKYGKKYAKHCKKYHISKETTLTPMYQK